MTETGMTTEHLSVAVTTETSDDASHTTNTIVSRLTHWFEFYFMWVVLITGIVGTASNALILYALVASKQHRKHILIFNQNALDAFCCVWLVIIYTVRLFNIDLSGEVGYWLCMLIQSENILWGGVTSSRVNLMIITVERYLKVVHRTWSKKRIRNWMIYLAIALTWIIPFILTMITTFRTAAVIDGVCHPLVIWPSQWVFVSFTVWRFVSFFAIPLFMFTFCYGRILMAIRRQARVMASHNTDQTQSHKIQTNVIKTMILVSAFFCLSNAPLDIFVLCLSANLRIPFYMFYTLVFISFVYICTNPFIYATKFKPVKDVLLDLIPCKKTTDPSTRGGTSGSADAPVTRRINVASAPTNTEG